MLKHRELTESRIELTLPRIQALFHPMRASLQIEAFAVGGEPIPYEEAIRRSFAPFSVGGKWGPYWDTTWFRFSGTIPGDWKGQEVVALINLGFLAYEGFCAEGLVWMDGKPIRALNTFRHDVPLALIARGGETFSFYVEAAANPKCSDIGLPMSADVANGLSVSGVHGAPNLVLEQAELATVNRAALDLYRDFFLANDLMKELRDAAPRRGQLLRALNDAVNIFDEFDPASLPAARAALKPVLEAKNGDSQHTSSAVGHAHIDTAWLWPLREAIRKCARTFSTQLAYMEEYPDFVFSASQAQQYAWMKEYYPSIFEGIKRAVKRGQWELVGSMWIEVDCNIPSGESIVRQILHGKNFFQDEFGIEVSNAWLPDVFGYSAALPQIFKKSGIDYFLTHKISWSQFNKFPHHTFLWEGTSGARVFVHHPPSDTYKSELSALQIMFGIRNFQENDRSNRSLLIFGHGDGGGGPTRDMIETARRARDLDGLPKITIEKAADFFEKAEKDAEDLPVWAGELDFDKHRGTYTTQAKNKRENRKCEFLLREAEILDSVVRVLLPEQAAAADTAPEALPYAVYDVSGRDAVHPSTAQDLDRAWKLLLLNQFHDIIPGSSIHWVYEDCEKDYATIRALAGRVIERRTEALLNAIDTSGAAKPLVLLNMTTHDRNEVIGLPNGVLAHVSVPGLGYAVLDADKTSAAASTPVSVETAADAIVLDNGIVRVAIDAQGLLSGVYDHRAKREVLAPGERGNVLQLHKDYPVYFDAWDLDAFAFETKEDLPAADEVTVVERHALRAAVRVSRRFGKSAITQKIVLRAGSARIDFETNVDWREDHRLLKASFPVNVFARNAKYEIQFGHIERPTHRNTSWDIARFEGWAHKWADLSEPDYGVALLNDCKYGYDILNNVMRLSLLRAPANPDPYADRGHHEFTYSLLPHTGDIRGGVIDEAYALNVPLATVEETPHKGVLAATGSFFQTDRAGVFIEAIKKAERENAIIIRLYEGYGTRGPVTLSTSLPFQSASLADLMERDIGPISIKSGTIELDVGPFEIVTIKLRAG